MTTKESAQCVFGVCVLVFVMGCARVTQRVCDNVIKKSWEAARQRQGKQPCLLPLHVWLGSEGGNVR